MMFNFMITGYEVLNILGYILFSFNEIAIPARQEKAISGFHILVV